MKRYSKEVTDPEIAAPAPDGPEQVLILPLLALKSCPSGGRDLGRDQVVAGEAINDREPTQPTAQSSPPIPVMDTDPERRGQSEGRLGARSETPSVRPGSARTVLLVGIDPGVFPAGQVKQTERRSTTALPATLCPAAPHREREPVVGVRSVMPRTTSEAFRATAGPRADDHRSCC